MSALALLDTLAGLGVHASVTPSGTLRVEPASRVPAELLEALKAHRDELLTELQRNRSIPLTASTGFNIPPLPEPLARLARAAAGGHLTHLASLPSGLVLNLGEYVLAWVAAYLTGDQHEARRRLEEARQAWGQA